MGKKFPFFGKFTPQLGHRVFSGGVLPIFEGGMREPYIYLTTIGNPCTLSSMIRGNVRKIWAMTDRPIGYRELYRFVEGQRDDP